MSFGVIEVGQGWMGYVYSERGLARLTLPLDSRHDAYDALGPDVFGAGGEDNKAAVGMLKAFLKSYFAGRPADAAPFTVDLAGHTEFQTQVLERVRAIPRGETLSYGELAAEVGRPGAARAVGATMASNPVCVIIPCHRVVAADGGLGGYGGGLPMKRRMLEMEGALDPPFTRRLV